MRFKTNFLSNYLANAPLSLASERAFECELLKKQEFNRPVLDIGCGDGIFAHLLFDEKLDTGIDINPIEVERCRTLDSYHELIVCPGNNIPKKDKYYNTILSNSVLEHIPDLKSVMKEAHRVLSDQGCFYLTVPTHRFEQAAIISRILGWIGFSKAQESFNQFYNRFWQHYHCYSPQDWENFFRQLGFKVAACTRYNSKFFASLHDCFAPIALPSFLARKYLRRWFFFPWLRKILSPLIYLSFIGPLHRYSTHAIDDGTLVFFKLTKDVQNEL